MRLFGLSILGMAAISIASAGQIEIGATSLSNSALNTSTGISTAGLDAAYVAGGTGDTWAAGEKAYNSTIFNNDVISSSSLGGSTLPTTANGYQQFTDPNNNVVFAMDADSGANFWVSSSSTTTAHSAPSINIPVGVFSVASVNVMLNDYYAYGNTDTVTFNFANYGAYSVTLTNGNQIDAATNCPVASPSDTTLPACTSYATTTSSPYTDAAWTANYANTTTSATNPFSNTAGTGANPGLGTLNLADIAFTFYGVAGLNFATDTLNSITIVDNNNCAPGQSGCSSVNSKLGLSAITVQQTPEPSTVLLLIGGLSIMGFVARRRKVRA